MIKNSPMSIRDACPADFAAIRLITLSAYEQYEPVMGPEHWRFYRKNIETTVANPAPAEQIVAEQDGAIVGTVLLFPAETVMTAPNGQSTTLASPEVRLLAVAPEARGQGIAAALMQECIWRARQAGCSALTLHTTDMMDVAMRMYEKMGFQRVPELDFFPSPDVTVNGYRYSL